MSRRVDNRFLVKAAFAPATQKKYGDAVDEFLDWLLSHGLDSDDPSEFDEILTDYLHELYYDGGGKGQAQATIFGLMAFAPQLKGRLHLSLLTLRGWQKLQPVDSYPPLSAELCVAVAVKLAFSGHWNAGVGVLLAFDCFLRVSELTGLRCEDVADSKDPRLSTSFKGMALRLRSTKTGPNQWVEVLDTRVQSLLRRLRSTRGASTSLLGLSTDRFRRLFKAACADLKLSPRYVPHSLRHGGATSCHLQGMTIEQILLRGRWASTKSAKRYIQSGRAMLLSMETPAALVQLLPILLANFHTLFSLSQQH